MKVYVIKEYLNDYTENGRNFRWVTVAYDPDEKVSEKHYEPTEGETKLNKLQISKKIC